jgi:Cys/Met metabolism PLP-dependent enzyme
MRSRRQNTAAALLEYDGSTARYKIRTHFCDLTKPESLTKVATQNCQVVYRPRYGFSPLPRVPRYFRPALPPWPLQHGVDIVVHSLTKDVGGFGTEMRGAVIGPGTYCNLLMLYRKDFGGVLSPKNARPILVCGLPTLAARMISQPKSAMQVTGCLQRCGVWSIRGWQTSRSANWRTLR